MSGGRPWTAADDAELRRLYPSTHNRDVAEALGRTEKAVSSRAKVLRLRKQEGFVRVEPTLWTPERAAWLRSYAPGHTEDEIMAEHERVFGFPLTRAQVANGKRTVGVRSGTHAGRFEKGRAAENKGKRWDEFMSPEAQRRVRESGNLFRKGREPHNAVPLLSERLSKEGSVFVKVRLHPRPGKKSPDCWMPLAVLNWERENHREWPDGCRCVYADHDPGNCDAGNVVPVPKELYVTVTGYGRGRGIEYHDRQTLEAAVTYARVVRERARIMREGGLRGGGAS